MSVIAFVPARIGSKGIPKKNIKNFCGKPLIYWVLSNLEISNVDKIIVATDSNEIINIVNSFPFSKVEIFKRSIENAQDTSSTESVMLEYLNTSNLLGNDIFMLVQATSPFTTSKQFNTGIDKLRNYDSVISCCISKRFRWDLQGNALNYDIYNRPRRQDFAGELIENGAFYISYVNYIKSSKNRVSGNIGVYVMPEETIIEIDEPRDWAIAENIMSKFLLINNKIDFTKIKLFLSDVDGVLTDGGMYYAEDGNEFKRFSTHDGMGFKILQEKGVKVGIITSENVELNKKRAKKLGLDFDFHGVVDKLQIVEELCKEKNICLSEVAYVGDDINCYNLLSNIGFAACPSNAINKIKNIPNIILLNKSGGEGVVREFIDKILLNEL